MAMRKRLLSSEELSIGEQWLDVGHVASVEVTSEDPEHTIESALLPSIGSGWQADRPGQQTIRVVFDTPQRVRRIRLRFVEPAVERTQQFTLRWAGRRDEPPREIVRQQWNFSPGGSTTEAEDYRIDLHGVSVLELTINPDVRSPDALASLAEWRIG
jgi:hypothetical protein